MIDFKQVELSDVQELSHLTWDIWHEFWTCILSSEQIDYMVEKFQSEKAIKNQITNENFIYFYILYEGQKAGYIGMCRKQDYVFLSKLYIKKEFRYKGIGTKSFGFIKDFVFENNYKKIKLRINKYNENSINAYLKWGFEITDAVVTDIGSGFVMDDYIMEYIF